jgi:hypothetical protein
VTVRCYDFLITHTETAVHVRWLTPVDYGSRHFVRELEAEFDGLHGVETVDMRKYSAVLTVATHVRTAAQVAEDVREVLESPNVRTTFRFAFGDAELKVDLIGRVVRL